MTFFKFKDISGIAIVLFVALCLSAPITSACAIGIIGGPDTFQQQGRDAGSGAGGEVGGAGVTGAGTTGGATGNAGTIATPFQSPGPIQFQKTSAPSNDLSADDPVSPYSAANAGTEELRAENVSLANRSKVYDGHPAEVGLVVTNSAGNILTEGKDYTISARNGSTYLSYDNLSSLVDAGNYSINIEGIGGYSGRVRTQYSIGERKLAKEDFSVSQEVYYTGGKVNLYDVITPAGWSPREGDYFLKPYGNDDITIVGHHRAALYASTSGSVDGVEYSGNCVAIDTLAIEFDILPGCIFLDPIPEAVYNANRQLPVLTVKNSAGMPLAQGEDYYIASYTDPSGNSCTYNDIIDAGRYGVQIVGMGNYTGSSNSATFTIKKAEFTVDDIPQQPFTASPSSFSLVVRNSANPDVLLTESTPEQPGDYLVSYFNSEGEQVNLASMWRLGNYTVKVTGTGANYRADCTVTKTFSIVNSNFKVQIVPDAVYNARPQLPALEIEGIDGAKLDGSLFSVSYKKDDQPVDEDQICDVGDYTITVKAPEQSSWYGEVSLPYRIVGAPLSLADEIPDRVYTTGSLLPELAVFGVDGMRLSEGSDFQVGYRLNGNPVLQSNLVNPGEYEVVVTGLNNYKGEVSAMYRITNGSLVAEVTGPVEFNGSNPQISVQAQSGGAVLSDAFVAVDWKNEDGTAIMPGETIHAGKAHVRVSVTNDIARFFATDENYTDLEVKVQSADAHIEKLSDYVYDGLSHAPNDCVVNSRGEKVGSQSYRLEYVKDDAAEKAASEDVIGVGTYTVQAHPFVSTDFANVPTSSMKISYGDWSLNKIEQLKYTGSPVRPEVQVTYEGKRLSPDLYKIRYTDVNGSDDVASDALIGPGSFRAYVRMVDTDNFIDKEAWTPFSIFRETTEIESGPSAEELFGIGGGEGGGGSSYEFRDRAIGLSGVEAPEDEGPSGAGASSEYNSAAADASSENGADAWGGQGSPSDAAEAASENLNAAISKAIGDALSSLPDWALGLGMIGLFAIGSCASMFTFYRRSRILQNELLR